MIQTRIPEKRNLHPVERRFSLYLHFPYCWSKCSYCAFNSVEYQKPQSLAFVQALKEEMNLYGRLPDFKARKLDTIFMGGGTPTIFPAEILLEILNHARNLFHVDENLETTVEANPGTVDPRKLKALCRGGVNRLSLGVQSFKKEDLEFLGRVHSVETVGEAYRYGREAGFTNINLDLISGLPGQRWEDFRVSLVSAVRLGPEHLSVYSLTPEEGTPIGSLYGEGKIDLPPEDSGWETDYKTAGFLASNGYRRYEVSNFARPGFECRHNLGYWEDRDFIGLGPGAHSFFGGRRFSNIPDIEVYNKTLGRGEFPLEWTGPVMGEERFFDALTFGLRKTSGVCLDNLHQRYRPGNTGLLYQRIKKWTGAGLMVCDDSFLRLTPEGIQVWDLLGEEIMDCFTLPSDQKESAAL